MITKESTQEELQNYWQDHHADYRKIIDNPAKNRTCVYVKFKNAKRLYRFNNINNLNLHKNDSVLVLTHLPKEEPDRKSLTITEATVVGLYEFDELNHQTGKKDYPYKWKMPIIQKL